MPQIAQLSTTFASQFFWIALIFGFVFFVVGRGMVPKVMATVETRDRQIASDLQAAQAARLQADSAEEAWHAHAAQQRAQAHALIARAKAEAAKATEGRLAGAAGTIDARIAAADERIAAARAGALGEIETVASEAASDIVSRIAGISIDRDASRAAVREVLHD